MRKVSLGMKGVWNADVELARCMEFIFHGNAVTGDASVHAFGRAFSRQIVRSMLSFCHQSAQLSVEGSSHVDVLFGNMGSH